MKIVIDIPEEKYRWIIENEVVYNTELEKAVRKGTPLPEWHGRLVSVNDLNNGIMMAKSEIRLGVLAVPIAQIFENIVRNAPTILSNEWLQNGE